MIAKTLFNHKIDSVLKDSLKHDHANLKILDFSQLNVRCFYTAIINEVLMYNRVTSQIVENGTSPALSYEHTFLDSAKTFL